MPDPSVNRLVSTAKDALWNIKDSFRRSTRSVLPPFVTYSQWTCLDGVREAWPALKAVFSEPYVHVPAAHERWLFEQHLHYSSRAVTLPPVAVNAIPDGLIFPRSGLVADCRGRIILESIKHLAMASQYREIGSLKRPRIPRIDETRPCATINNGPAARNWFHWITDALPRLFALGQLGQDVVLLVPKSVRGARLELLERARPDNVELRFLDSGSPVRCREALLSPFTTITGCGLLRPEIAAFLRAKLLEGVGSADRRKPGDRIYTTRQRESVRRVENEDELLIALQALGFRVVDPGLLGWRDQVACFANARIVVGLHGANLTGLLFSSDAIGVEIAPVNLAYWGLCVSCGNKYVGIPYGTTLPGRLGSIRETVQPAASVVVDVERVLGAVNRALAVMAPAGVE